MLARRAAVQWVRGGAAVVVGGLVAMLFCWAKQPVFGVEPAADFPWWASCLVVLAVVYALIWPLMAARLAG